MQIAALRASSLGIGRCYCDQHPGVRATEGQKRQEHEILTATDAECAQLGAELSPDKQLVTCLLLFSNP